MAANKMQFQYEVTANTSQARKALADLDKALDRLNKQQKMDMGLSQELTEAADAARLLQRELNAAMDVKTGKLNVSELARGLAQAGTSVEQLSTKFLNAGTMGEAAFRGLAQSIVAAEVPMKRMNKTLSDAMTTLKNTVKWEISSTLVHGLEGAFSGAVSYAKNLNTSLTNIRIVTNQSIDDMVKFTKQANAAAKELSTTTKAYADASLIYYQQGDSQELAAKKAAITIKASNASFETSAKEMSEYLTSVWNSYQVGADELERYVDIMANLGAKTATSLEEIATSMQKVAATANTVGVSMEQVSSIIATVSSVTRESAESIGTSYKTIFARIGDLKLGKVDEDGVGLGQVSSQLDAIGIKILDETGNLREMGDIIMDLGTKWQTMNQAQKTAVAQVVAGKRQYTQLMALFENWDMFQSNMNIAENSEGALQNMANIYAESWEAASNRVQASVEGIYNQIINDQAIIKFTNGLASTLDIVGDLVEGLGGIEGVVTLVGSTMALTFKNKIAGSVNEAVNSVSNFVKSFKGMSGMDVVKSLFGSSTGLREYQQQINQLQSQLRIIVGGGAGMDAAQATNLQKIIELKKELLNQEKLLSTSERERIQSSINSLMNQVGSIEELNQSYADQNRYVNQLATSLASLTAQQEAYQRATGRQTTTQEVGKRMQSNIDQYFRKGKTKQNYEGQDVRGMFSMNEIPLAGNKINLQDLIKQFEKLNIAAEGATSASSGLQNLLSTVVKLDNATKQTKAIEMLENLKNVYSQKGLSTSWIDELINKLKNGNLNNINDTIREVDQSLTKFANTAGNKAAQAMRFLEGALGLNHDRLVELAQAAGLSTEQLRRLAQAYRDLNQGVNNTNANLRQNTRKFGEVFANIVSGATSAMFSFSAMSSAVENWDTSSLTQKITSVGSLLTDLGRDIARGDIGAIIGDIVGAGLGAIFGAIEKKAKEAKEQVDSINKSILESAAELDKTSKAADQAIDNYEEASKQYEAGNLSQNDYLQIIDSVLGALDAEHLKVLALKGDYDGLRKAIEGANQERLAGDEAKAKNLVNTGYYNLIDSLNAYQGLNADSKYGRNGINLSNDGNTVKALQALGFTLNTTGVNSWGWEGNQTDLAQLQSDWEKIQTNSQYEIFRESKDFNILFEYMKQFEPIFTAMDTWAQTSASKELSELDISTLTSDNAYDTILNTVLTSFGTSAEEATPYQMEMAQNIAKDWVANLSTGIQTGFYEGLNNDQTAKTAKEYAAQYTSQYGQQYIQVAQDATLPTFLLTKNEEGKLANAISQTEYENIEKYKNYVSAWNASQQPSANIEALLASTGIDPAKIGINLAEGQSISDYLATASEQTKNALLENLRTEIDTAITGLNINPNNYSTQFEGIIKDQQQEVLDFFTNSINNLSTQIEESDTGLIRMDNVKYAFDQLYQDTEGLYRDAWKQLKFDENGLLEWDSYDQLMTSSLGMQLDKNVLDTMIDLEEYNLFDFDSAFEYIFSIWDGRIKDFESWWQGFINTTKTEVEKTQNDFNQLKELDTDHTKWDEDEFNMFSTQAKKYGVDTSDWSFKTEAQQSEDVYNVMQAAFNKQQTKQQWTQEDIASDPLGYSNYLAALQDLNKYALQETESSMKDLETNYSNIESILSTLMSLDLTKNIDETVVSAEKFAEIMGMSIDDFNKKYTTASQKQLAILQTQQKYSQQYADNLRTQAEEWYNATGKTLIEQGDMVAMQTWAVLSTQVATAQGEAAQSADAVNAAYATLNDEAVAGIASQWERANKEAEKQQKIASILASSVDSGIISHEEAAIVDIPVEEWASYTAEVRAAKAANAAFAASNAAIESLETEQKAVAGAIEYYDEYKNAWKQHIKDADGFEQVLYNSYSMGDFGDGDEAIAKMNAFREARNKAIQNLGQGASADAILTEMSVILNIDKDDLESQIKQVAGSNKDTIASIFANMSQEIKNKAQEAVDAWLSAFDTIAEARKTLLAGGSLIDQLAGDPKKIQEVFANFDGTWEEFMSGILDGSLDIDKLVTPKLTESYLQERYTAAGVATLTGSNEERRAEARKLLEAQAEPGEEISDEAVTAKVAQDYETAIKGLVEQGLISMSDDQIKADAMALAKGEHAMGDALLAAINTYLAEAQSRIDFSEQLRVEKAKRAEDAVAISEAAKMDQTEYDEQIRLQKALEAAQAVKEKKGDWEDIDSKDRQILEANGITGLNQVDSAAMQCASALASLAEAAYNAAKTEAEARGYSQNEAGEWGIQHTATMTEEEGRNLYGSDWDQYKTGLTQTDDGLYQYDTNFEVIKEINDPFQEANETMEELKGSMEDLPKDLWESDVKSFGLDPDEVDKLGDSIQELAKTSDQLGDSLITDAEAADELAKKMSRYNKAVEAVTNNHKKWDKAMKTGGVEEQAEAMEEMREAMSDMLDADYDELSDGFIKNAENLELMKEAAEGNNDAFDELQARAARDMVIDAQVQASFDEDSFNAAAMELASAYDDLPIGEPIVLGENTTVGDSFWSACNSILSGFAATAAGAQQAQAAFAKLGYDAEVVVEDQPVEGYTASYPMYKQGPPLQIGMGQTFHSVIGSTETIEVPGYTQKVLAIKSITPNGAGFGGNIKKGSGGSGGGGSKAKKKEKKQQKRYQDEIERYHKNTEVLNRLSEELDKIDKLKERTYGNKHIDQLNAETAALKEQLEAQQALHDEAKKYQASDQIAVARYGAQFDADGTIVNYEEVMRNIVDEYNRAVDVYNSSEQEDGDKERLEAAEQRFEDAKKSIDDYEEAIAKANESMNDMLETQNQISEIETEKITYKLELQIEMNERDLERFEYYQEKYENSLKDQGIVYKSIYDSMLEYENNLVVIGEAMAALDQKRRDGLITDADYAETLQDLYDQIFENLGDLNEIQNELVDTYTNTLELAREEVEKTTDTIESANNALQSYLDIIALSGGETDYEKMEYFYEKMNENNLIKINIQRDHLNALLEEEDKFQEKIKSGQQLTDLEKQQYEALREEIQDTRDTLLSSTTEALEAIRTTYENTINGIAKDFEEFMVGAGDSIEHLQEQYGYFQEEQENYVSTAKELYEVSKLNRDIEGALGDATSKAAKEALKALQEKINKQSELNQLTEYDIEMNQLQYELLMARIKLEESQNAKDVVRLTRDENGNYAYRYTANQDKIDEAVQNYEDKLQEINDLTVQRTSEIEGRMLETMAWAKEQMSAIAMDYTLTEEEKRDRLAELNSQFAAKMQYLHEQNGIATENLITNQEAIAEHYGVNLSEITSSTAGNVNTQIQSMIEKTQEYITKMNEALFGEGGADQSWKDYLEDIGIITSNAGTAYGDMVENTQEMGEMNHWSAEQAQEVIETLTDTLEPLETLTAAWDAHNSILEATISDYENLAQVIQGVLSAVGEIPNGGSATDVDGHAYAKGGMVDYTGLAWVDGSPSDPEMMLNPGDTQNILKATAMVKSLDSGFIGALVDSVKSAAQAMMHMFSGAAHAVTNIHPAVTESLEQSVHITAEFPNVQDHNEIEEALLGLVNRSAQFANQKK